MTFLETIKKLIEGKEGAEAIADALLASGELVPITKFNAKNQELATLKTEHATAIANKDKELQDFKMENATEEQRQALLIEQLQTQNQAFLLDKNKSNARAKLLGAGYEDGDTVNKLVENLVTLDEVQTNAVLDTIIGERTTFLEQAKANIKNDILNGQQDVGGDTATPPEASTDDVQAFLDGIDSIIEE